MIRNISITLALACVAVASTTASAQRGGDKRGTRSDFDGMIAGSPVGLRLSNGDVEDMNPVKLLADKRKDLKLTDEQHKQLKTMVDALKESTKTHFKSLDSLRTEIRPRAGADAEIEAIRTRIAREAVPELVKVIRGAYAQALPGALALLDDTQKAKADELIKKQAADADQTVAEKAGGGRGGAGGRGGRRGGPPPAR